VQRGTQYLPEPDLAPWLPKTARRRRAQALENRPAGDEAIHDLPFLASTFLEWIALDDFNHQSRKPIAFLGQVVRIRSTAALS